VTLTQTKGVTISRNPHGRYWFRTSDPRRVKTVLYR
jgi:hypothetical protein